MVPFVFLLSKSSTGLTQPQNYKQLLMVWKYSVNDTLERHKTWRSWWECEGTGGHVEPKEGTSHWVIVSVLLSLHSYQRGGRQDSHQLWLWNPAKNFNTCNFMALWMRVAYALEQSPGKAEASKMWSWHCALLHLYQR